ncbi:LAMI_0F06084g1_1 [Lachancea mirantina]|uniref:LAMI_0F06084g1_1 n=1 Tax=Lachancea mirantina TaxID=1230905 RepID=A0A1G4JYQ3_9SACH|nr:LAMI_0F06084g1_1 [Lachancea mirantina]
MHSGDDHELDISEVESDVPASSNLPIFAADGEGNEISEVRRKRLACSNCRRRRKKCDLNYPCSSCLRLKLDCNVNMEDMRKKRYAATYVKALEAHVSHLEQKLRNLANAASLNVNGEVDPKRGSHRNGGRRGQDGRNSDLEQVLPNVPIKLSPSPSAVSLETDILRRKMFVKGSIYPEGPASYKPKRSEPGPVKQQQRISDLKTTVIVRSPAAGAKALSTDEGILKSLSNFYRHLYPGHFIFMHRESFLYGLFNHYDDNYENSQYCSEELVYAVAALGSSLTRELRSLSTHYYRLAKEKLLKIVFDEQSMAKITSVQALLCLAFYELGSGNNQLAWYFSGLAIRVGYDMGFQLDPKVWITDDINTGKLSESELEIRSRIYWGCYIADHFICLLLGRTSTLSVSNSTVPESDELPEVEGTEEFRFDSKYVLQVSLPLKNLIILSRIVQIFTSKIFIEPGSTPQRIEYLLKFNLKVYNWRQSLPDFWKWSKNLMRDTDISTDPTISYFWYHYYIVLLTFNKPFIEDCDESKVVVLEALGDLKVLLSNFKARFGSFGVASLYLLYSCLLALACLRKLVTMLPDPQITAIFSSPEGEMKFFSETFKQFSPTYDLPRRMQDDAEFEHEQEKQPLNQLSSLANTYDFSLSDEIDDLIKQVFGFDNWNINPTHTI